MQLFATGQHFHELGDSPCARPGLLHGLDSVKDRVSVARVEPGEER